MANKPTLALIPSAYKASKVYSVLPNNGDGDFTFSRTGSATRVNKDGFIETVASNVPRLDYSEGSCPALLLEPQRTNLVTYSEDFSQWNKGVNTTVTQNFAISPDGTQNATRFQTPAGSGTYLTLAASMAIGNDYTLTLYLKNNGGENADIGVAASSTVGAGTASREVNLTNEWVRYELNFTADSNSNFVFIDNISNANSVDCLIWGAQLEQLSYPTSYIPTNGSTVTRLADNCYGAGDSNLFDTTLGTFYLDITPYLSENSPYYISMSDGTNNNRFDLFFYDSQQIRFYVIGNGGSSVSAYYAIPFNQRMKVAVTFRENEFYFFVNGNLITKDTSGNIPIGLDRLNFSAYYNGAFFEGKVHEARFYNEVLSTTELATLTSL